MRDEGAGQQTGVQRAGRGELDCRFGAGHGEERTRNMWFMFVTLEVSQLEISALKLRMPLKSPPMSVMAETHQSAMGPYVAVAAAGFAS